MARRTALETAVGDVYAELAKQWAASTVSFARCFNIENKDNEMVPFEPSVPQQRAFWLMENEKRIQILKGRQMWITTACVIQALKLAYFNPGMRIGVATQKTKTAKALALLYLKRYRQNPALVAMMPLLNFSSEHIRFTNGTEIIFDTANSEVWRSGVFHFVHLTECSYYDDLGALLAALGETVPKKTGVIIMETTANGEEAYCGMWKDKISTYRKQFLCWRDHLEYRDPIPFTDEILDLEADYIRKNGLDDEEASWWIRKRRGMPSENRHLMQQEYPCTPEEAFLLSGPQAPPGCLPCRQAACVGKRQMPAVRRESEDRMSQCHAKIYDAMDGSPHRCPRDADAPGGLVCAVHSEEVKEYKALSCRQNHYTGCACHEARRTADCQAAVDAVTRTLDEVESLLAKEQAKVAQLRLYTAGLAGITRPDIVTVYGVLTAILEDK